METFKSDHSNGTPNYICSRGCMTDSVSFMLMIPGSRETSRKGHKKIGGIAQSVGEEIRKTRTTSLKQ